MMYIYCLPITNSLWQDTETHLLPFVSPRRQRKVLNYYHPIDQKLSLYSALLTRMQLSILTGLPNNCLRFQCNSYGKPLLLSNPQYYFNFSHTHNIILCGISNVAPVGIDVESISKDFSIHSIYEGLHPIEKQYINNFSLESQYVRFYKIWTQKEAFVKFEGTGFSTESSTINTLDPKLAYHLYTWQYTKYICSAFLPKPDSQLYIRLIHESEVQNYFFKKN